jgi:hypothetical protein
MSRINGDPPEAVKLLSLLAIDSNANARIALRTGLAAEAPAIFTDALSVVSFPKILCPPTTGARSDDAQTRPQTETWIKGNCGAMKTGAEGRHLISQVRAFPGCFFLTAILADHTVAVSGRAQNGAQGAARAGSFIEMLLIFQKKPLNTFETRQKRLVTKNFRFLKMVVTPFLSNESKNTRGFTPLRRTLP